MDWSIFPYGAYVAFAFSCMLFGGLAYRQIIDRLDLRTYNTGEDLDLFLSAPGVILSAVGGLLLIPLGLACYGTDYPTIWKYALPLVGFVQLVQLSLRLYFQRLRLRTRAVVIRYMLRSGCTVIPYVDIAHIDVRRGTFWSTIRIRYANNEASTFRIFRFSEPALLERISALSGVLAAYHESHAQSS